MTLTHTRISRLKESIEEKEVELETLAGVRQEYAVSMIVHVHRLTVAHRTIKLTAVLDERNARISELESLQDMCVSNSNPPCIDLLMSYRLDSAHATSSDRFSQISALEASLASKDASIVDYMTRYVR